MLNKVIFLSLCCIPFYVTAAESKGGIKKPDGLSLGIGTVGSTGLYIGEKTEFTPIPIISYEGERFFIRGLYAGMELYRNELVTFNAVINANMNHLDIDKLSTSKLAEKNLKKSQLENRDRSADLGIEAIVRIPYGLLSIQAVNDIGSASKAAEVKLNYQYFWRINNQFTLIPNVGFDWLSNERANYYYGILDREVAKGVKEYKPDQIFVPHVSLGASYSFSDNIRVTGVAMHKFLPNKIEDGPLIDKDSLTNFFMAVTYKF